jgi:hypothetical protein
VGEGNTDRQDYHLVAFEEEVAGTSSHSFRSCLSLKEEASVKELVGNRWRSSFEVGVEAQAYL